MLHRLVNFICTKIILSLIIAYSILVSCNHSCSQNTICNEKIAHAVDSALMVERHRVSKITSIYLTNLVAADSLDEVLSILRLERFYYHPYPTNYFLEGWILDKQGNSDAARECYRLALEANNSLTKKQPTLGNSINAALYVFLLNGKNAFDHYLDSLETAYPDSVEYVRMYRTLPEEYEEQSKDMMKNSHCEIFSPTEDKSLW